MADYDDDLHAARQQAAALAGAHVVRHPSRAGMAAAVDAQPGWRIFSATRTYNDNPEPGLRSPLGGVVVEVVHGRQLHPETGEIADLTVYRCLNTWRPKDPWVNLETSEVDGRHAAGVDRTGAWHAILWLLAQVHTRRRSPTGRDLDHIGDAYRLARAIA